MSRKHRHRGGSSKLKKWARKAMQFVRQHAPGIIKKYKLASRGLAYASKRLPKYSAFINPIQKFAAMRGYGIHPTGGALRSVGGRKCSKYCRRRR